MSSTEVIDPEEVARENAARRKAERAAKRAARKAAKALAKLRAAQRLKRIHFNRETKYVVTTYERAAEDWDRMLSDIQHGEMKIELEALWGDLQHSLDSKSNLIKRLSDDKEDAQDQFRRFVQSHLELMVFSQNTFNVILKSMKNAYETETAVMLAEFYRETAYREHISGRRKFQFENLLHNSNLFTSDYLHSYKTQFRFDFEDVSNVHIGKRDQMCDSVVHHMQNLYAQMCEAFRLVRCTSMTGRRMRVYSQLVDREIPDENSFALLTKQITKTQLIFDALLAERQTLALSVMAEMAEMRHEKDYFIDCYRLLRSIYEEDMLRDERNTRRVAAAANVTIDELRALDRRGTILLGICSSCRKLETEEEKVLPTSEYVVEKEKKNPYELDLSHLAEMKLYWTRVAIVSAHNDALAEERRVLLKENANLQELIRRYCAQSEYSRAIASLRLSASPTQIIPFQEVGHGFRQNKKPDRPY